MSEEHYIQEIRRPVDLQRRGMGTQTVTRRVLRSDYLLVQLGPGADWMPFRDVFEEDGEVVRDREDRLIALFLSNEANRFELARRIMDESTRYNLGNVTRTINIPTLAMMLLHPSIRDRFAFAAAEREQIAGEAVQRVRYRETGRPTLIKTTRGRDLPLEGVLSVDADTGTVVKSELTASDPAVYASVTVLFGRHEAMEIRVPERMEEFYRAGNRRVRFIPSYADVRQFQVKTAEKLAKPPGQRGSGSSRTL